MIKKGGFESPCGQSRSDREKSVMWPSLSVWAHDLILKVARPLADLDAEERIRHARRQIVLGVTPF